MPCAWKNTVHEVKFRHDTLTRLLICAASGACASLCFEPYAYGFLAYFILVPYILFSGILDGRARYLLNSYVFGAAYFLGTLYWIALLDREQILMPWLRFPAALAAALYLSLFMLLAGFLMRRMVAAGVPFQVAVPLAWGGVEYLRSLGVLGFPWGSLAYSQTPYAGVIQQAALYGTYGMSAWLAAVNALIAWLMLSRRKAALAALALALGVPLIGGRLVLMGASYEEGPPAALIQPDIGGQVKWDKAFTDSTMWVLSQMTLEAPPSRLIVWPETAVPFFVRHDTSSLARVENLARAKRAYILFGLPDYTRGAGGSEYYNSAMLVGPDGDELGIYRKMHLVPFGEMIPFEDRLEFLRGIDFGEGDFTAGREYTVMSVDGLPFGVAICFESIFPELTRQFVRRGARFIVNITNDEWFGPSLGPSQHAQMAVMRTVECRVGLVRCANTGISMVVDPYGRRISETALFKRTVLAGNIPLGTGDTPYVEIGDIFPGIMLLLSLLIALRGRVR
jgi:apolipoprotein N-acyltransferase